MAIENELSWTTLAAVTAAAKAFLDPVLQGDEDLLWQPGQWLWQAR